MPAVVLEVDGVRGDNHLARGVTMTRDLSWTRVPKSLGVGIGLRKEFYEELPETDQALDWIEIVPENFMGWGGRSRIALERCRDRWPVIPHGVSLNIGGLEPLDAAFLDGVRDLCVELESPFWSDHLCYSRVDGVYLHDLLPLPQSREAVDHVVGRIREAQERVDRPFILENPSYYAVMPGSRMSESEFLTRVVEEADCGLLLDVNNVYVNSQNHDYDPRAFIESLPLERVLQIHLAGHERRPVAIIDTHGAPVPDPVWELYEFTLERTGQVSTLIEWDANIPGANEVLAEAHRARTYYDQAAPVGARP
jgi:uncharacterized protein